ncbi:MAG TPA: SCO family protein [Streptosporangiaceae bacterium]|nr:SCO family protein [Streptosporangiaceae bacterium]
MSRINWRITGRRFAAAAVTATVLAACAPAATRQAAPTADGQAAVNPNLDPGTSLGGVPAPGFRLTDQFGQQVSLSDFRGKVVILAFTDSQCTTICPLSTVSMLQATELLGRAGDQVQLLAVDANPKAATVADVMAYSRSHGMVNHWDFLTGTPRQLRSVWRAYHIAAQIQAGQVDHTPALFLIDQQGRERKVFLTTMAYATVAQAGQVLAQAAANLIAGHPKLVSVRSLGYISGLAPSARATLPALPSGSVTVGPGGRHLIVFFATWLGQTSDLRARLQALDSYARAARARGLPGLIAVDEAVTEPSLGFVRGYLARLRLGYPVALDTTGRLADGYEVADQPWFVLTSASGSIEWHHDGWLPAAALELAARKS